MKELMEFLENGRLKEYVNSFREDNTLLNLQTRSMDDDSTVKELAEVLKHNSTCYKTQSSLLQNR